jgi:hypothetical protein
MRRPRTTLAVLLLVDFVAYVPNFPELGLETRGSDVAPALMALYTFAIFAPLAGAALVRFLPRTVGVLAIVLGAVNIVPSVLDLARVLFPQPPPAAIAVDEVVVIIIGLALIGAGARLARQSRPSIGAR